MTLLATPVCVITTALRIWLSYFCNIEKGTAMYALYTYYERAARAILGIALFLLLYPLLQRAKSRQWVQIASAYSYAVYIVHQWLMFYPISLMEVTGSKPMNWLILTVAIVLSAWLLQLVSGKISAKIKLR